MRPHDRVINSWDYQPTLESSGWHCREISSLRPPGQVQSLYLPTPEVKRFAGCQEVPVTRVAGLPVFHDFCGTGVREEIEIGAIEDTILILDEKRALLSEASTSGSAFSPLYRWRNLDTCRSVWRCCRDLGPCSPDGPPPYAIGDRWRAHDHSLRESSAWKGIRFVLRHPSGRIGTWQVGDESGQAASWLALSAVPKHRSRRLSPRIGQNLAQTIANGEIFTCS
jgi:hypothetical protein